MRKNFIVCAVLLLILASAVYGDDIQIATSNAEAKLKANNFLLTDEIDEIYETEQTPGVWDKFSDTQKKAILAEYKSLHEANAKKSLSFGASIKDPLEQSIYQDGVLNNMMLKSAREIAKKHGIKAGDVFMLELHMMMAGTK